MADRARQRSRRARAPTAAIGVVLSAALLAVSTADHAAENNGRATGVCDSAKSILVLPFDMVDTSMQATMNHGPLKADVARLKRTGAIVRRTVNDQPQFHVLDNSRARKAIDRAQSSYRYLYRCNGCETAIGRQAGADLVMTGWLQKVSNLILNINATIYSVDTGDKVAGASTGMRGDTDASWRYAAKYMVTHSLEHSYCGAKRNNSPDQQGGGQG